MGEIGESVIGISNNFRMEEKYCANRFFERDMGPRPPRAFNARKSWRYRPRTRVILGSSSRDPRYNCCTGLQLLDLVRK